MEKDQKIPVQCSVENCRFNHDRMCRADALEVIAMGDGMAESSLGTCCKTFQKPEEDR